MKWRNEPLPIRGDCNNAPPFGCDVEKAFLKVNEQEAKMVQLIHSMYLEQGCEVGKIARYFE